MELKTSRGASLQSRGVSHSQVPAASVVPHAHAATDDKDNLCSTSSLGFARGGNQLAGSILALRVGRYPFLLYAACRWSWFGCAFECQAGEFLHSAPVLFRVKGLCEGRLGVKTVISLMQLDKS